MLKLQYNNAAVQLLRNADRYLELAGGSTADTRELLTDAAWAVRDRFHQPQPFAKHVTQQWGKDKRVVCSGFGKTEQRLQRFSVDTTRDLLSGNITGRTCVTVNKYIVAESQRARVLAAIRMREDEQ